MITTALQYKTKRPALQRAFFYNTLIQQPLIIADL